jgi:thioredoxin 1
MGIKKVTDNTFENDIKEGLVLVDFWAPWCGPCKMIAPVLEAIDKEMGDQVKILKMNVDEEEKIPAKFQIMSIPTLKFFKNGVEIENVMGYQPKEQLINIIKKYV